MVVCAVYLLDFFLRNCVYRMFLKLSWSSLPTVYILWVFYVYNSSKKLFIFNQINFYISGYTWCSFELYCRLLGVQTTKWIKLIQTFSLLNCSMYSYESEVWQHPIMCKNWVYVSTLFVFFVPVFLFMWI